MSIIDYNRVDLLMSTTQSSKKVSGILEQSQQLKRLSLEDVALLLNQTDPMIIQEIETAAKAVKKAIYGNRLVIFAPLYISNRCSNDCLYCGFRSSNHSIHRQSLDQKEIYAETLNLLKTGQKRILLVAGESSSKDSLDYIYESIDTIYSVHDGQNQIRRVNANIAPLSIDQFKRLKEKNIGTYQIFQETYHPETYATMHPTGPKSDYDYRLAAVDRAFQAGLHDVGIGILFGLYHYKYEILAMMSHIEYLERTFGMGPHTLSVPRLEPATGSTISKSPPYPVTDDQFKLIIAILRLAVPYTGMVLSTRETPDMRRLAFDLGVSQVSAGSRTNPGGYSTSESTQQFSLGDHRTLDQVILDICNNGYIPSFCTSCYRLGRTGLDFMEYAKPGAIQKKCTPNALVTFQEYLSDYASEAVQKIGKNVIKKELAAMSEDLRHTTELMLAKIEQGQRDIYV